MESSTSSPWSAIRWTRTSSRRIWWTSKNVTGVDFRPTTVRGIPIRDAVWRSGLFLLLFDVLRIHCHISNLFPGHFQDISFLLIYPFPFPICFFEVNESTITLWSLYRADNETPVFLIGPKRPIPVLVTSKMLWGKCLNGMCQRAFLAL